jgi:hypothetical protein
LDWGFTNQTYVGVSPSKFWSFADQLYGNSSSKLGFHHIWELYPVYPLPSNFWDFTHINLLNQKGNEGNGSY